MTGMPCVCTFGQVLQQVPPRPLTYHQTHDEQIRLQRIDLLGGVGHEVGRGDVVVLFQQQVPQGIEEIARPL
jgi:hypothetical protein